MESYTFIAESNDIGKRIDSYLAEEIDDISRSFVQRLIDDQKILVNQKCIKSNYKLRLSDVVDVEIPEAVPISIEPEDIPLDIVYEDSEVIVINKPQNMVVHPAAGHYTNTLVNALMYHCKDELSGINGVMRPGIVHRIDKNTSGLLMVAKTNLAHQSLAMQLKEHSITRRYNAIVFSNIKEDEGTIDRPIGRHPVDRKKMAVVSNGRNAVTHYKVLQRFGKFTMIEARLETGRTHQIRVHMSYIGHPLLGDDVYGPKNQPFNLEGQVLHAKVLGFIHPVTGEYLEFESELPDYFKELINKLINS